MTESDSAQLIQLQMELDQLRESTQQQIQSLNEEIAQVIYPK